MLIALTRPPGPALACCEITYLARRPIDTDRAEVQHRMYEAALREASADVITLSADPAFPDGVFVEDVAVVLDEIAVLTSPAPVSRRGESAAVEAALAPYRRCLRLPPDAFLEGGDVLRIGRTLFIGQSSRTGQSGTNALEAAIYPFGYSVVPVRVTGCLHLKTAVSALDDETVLINRGWVANEAFRRFRQQDVPESEPFAANVLQLPDRIVASAAYPATLDLLQRRNVPVVALDVSELHKAEAGLTCMSLIFDHPAFASDSRRSIHS